MASNIIGINVNLIFLLFEEKGFVQSLSCKVPFALWQMKFFELQLKPIQM